jgi:hypothetical protein
MAQGVEAVKAALERDFGQMDFSECRDDTRDISLDFQSESRLLTVRVTHQYDVDYPKTLVRVDLKRLGRLLRTSRSGRAVVSNTGIGVE